MDPQNFWKDDPWKDVPEDQGEIPESFVSGVLRRLQGKTILRDIASLFFTGFSSILGGFLQSGFVENKPDEDKSNQDNER